MRKSEMGAQLIHISLWYNTGLAAAAAVETDECASLNDAMLNLDSVSELTSDRKDDGGAS